MKVLFVCSGNVKSFEVVPFIKEQGESLKKVGIEVDYFPIVGKGLKGYFSASRKLREHLKANKYDLIHAHFTHSGWTAVLAAGGTPVILSLMGSDAYRRIYWREQSAVKKPFQYVTYLSYSAVYQSYYIQIAEHRRLCVSET